MNLIDCVKERRDPLWRENPWGEFYSLSFEQKSTCFPILSNYTLYTNHTNVTIILFSI